MVMVMVMVKAGIQEHVTAKIQMGLVQQCLLEFQWSEGYWHVSLKVKVKDKVKDKYEATVMREMRETISVNYGFNCRTLCQMYLKQQKVSTWLGWKVVLLTIDRQFQVCHQ
jgi:hypothetical protein